MFEEAGQLGHYVGGYSDWAARKKALLIKDDQNKQKSDSAGSNSTQNNPNSKPKKLSYKYQRELDALPKQIEQLEKAVKELQETTLEAGFYEQDYEVTQAVLTKLGETEQALDTASERWLELEEMRDSL